MNFQNYNTEAPTGPDWQGVVDTIRDEFFDGKPEVCRLVEGRTNDLPNPYKNGATVLRIPYSDKISKQPNIRVIHIFVKFLDFTYGWYDSKEAGKKTRGKKWRAHAWSNGLRPVQKHENDWSVGRIKAEWLCVERESRLGRHLRRLDAMLETDETMPPAKERDDYYVFYRCSRCGKAVESRSEVIGEHVLRLTEWCAWCIEHIIILPYLRSLPAVEEGDAVDLDPANVDTDPYPPQWAVCDL
jgi:hypothetical protein